MQDPAPPTGAGPSLLQQAALGALSPSASGPSSSVAAVTSLSPALPHRWAQTLVGRRTPSSPKGRRGVAQDSGRPHSLCRLPLSAPAGGLGSRWAWGVDGVRRPGPGPSAFSPLGGTAGAWKGTQCRSLGEGRLGAQSRTLNPTGAKVPAHRASLSFGGDELRICTPLHLPGLPSHALHTNEGSLGLSFLSCEPHLRCLIPTLKQRPRPDSQVAQRSPAGARAGGTAPRPGKPPCPPPIIQTGPQRQDSGGPGAAALVLGCLRAEGTQRVQSSRGQRVLCLLGDPCAQCR